MDSNHDIIPALRAANYSLTDLAIEEIERLRAEVATLKAAKSPAKVGGDAQQVGDAKAAVIAAALSHSAETASHAFVVPIPNTTPALFVAFGEREQIATLSAPANGDHDE